LDSVIIVEYSWTVKEDNVKPASEGYKWVAGAKKADIEWDLMKDIILKEETNNFLNCERACMGKRTAPA